MSSRGSKWTEVYHVSFAEQPRAKQIKENLGIQFDRGVQIEYGQANILYNTISTDRALSIFFLISIDFTEVAKQNHKYGKYMHT